MKYYYNWLNILNIPIVFIISSGGEKGWHVFYHFVGAVPGSTELEKLLKRLLKETEYVDVRLYCGNH